MASNPPEDGEADDPLLAISDPGAPEAAAERGVSPLTSRTIPAEEGLEEKDAADGLVIELAAAWSGNEGLASAVDDVVAPHGVLGAHEMAGQENAGVDMFDEDEGVDVRAEDAEFELIDEKMIDQGGTDAGGGEDRNVQAEEPERQERRKRGRPRRSTTVEDGLHAGYSHRLQDELKEGFAVGELVWGKVRSHPWWPGQIFDAADASEMALNAEKEGHYLVVYFGDKTFAWCNESNLKRFQRNFGRLEKQGSTDAFVTAVSDALGEVSSLMDIGMTCSCSSNEAYVLEDRKVENAGVREGVCAAVDKSWIMNSFEPEELVSYMRMLALSPCDGADRLDLVIAKAHLKAFHRSNGHPALTSLVGQELGSDSESSSATERTHGNAMVDMPNPIYSDSCSDKDKLNDKSGTSTKKKHVLEAGRKKKSLSELMADKSPYHLDSGINLKSRGSLCSLDKSQKNAIFCPSVSGKSKMKRLDSLGDLPTPSLKFNKLLRVEEKNDLVAGTKIRSVTMTNRSSSELNRSKSATLDNLILHLGSEKIKECLLKDCSPYEMLSHLCLAAMNPLEAQISLDITVTFFTEFNHWVISSSSEVKIMTEIVGRKRGRGRLTKFRTAPFDLAASDYIQDSYWSDIIVWSNFEELGSRSPKRNGESRANETEEKGCFGRAT